MTPFHNSDRAPEWHAARVMVFNGSRDTHIDEIADQHGELIANPHPRACEEYDTITLADLFQMQPGSTPKEKALACIPGDYCSYDGRKHQVQRQKGSFVCLTADIDKGNASLDTVKAFVEGVAPHNAWLIYSSAHASAGDMRWRIIIPLAGSLPFGHWNCAQNAFFNLMDRAGLVPDRSLERAAQPVFLPNVPAVRASTSERLRGEKFGEPLFYKRASSDLLADGLSIGVGAINAEIAAIVRQERADEKERVQLRIAAQNRRKGLQNGSDGSPIDDFNKGADLRTLLEAYGYAQSPHNGLDWRSPHQTSGTYATRIIENKWVSLSGSDAGAGLGATCSAGCYGDAYDLFVHYEHDGDHKAAFRALHQERVRQNAYRLFGKPEKIGEAR